jgi:hypothetical protein
MRGGTLLKKKINLQRALVNPTTMLFGSSGVMIFADSRYNRHDKRSKLPKWIQQFVRPSSLNVSTDGALDLVRKFLRDMAQPVAFEQMQPILLDAAAVNAVGRVAGVPSAAKAESAIPVKKMPSMAWAAVDDVMKQFAESDDARPDSREAVGRAKLPTEGGALNAETQSDVQQKRPRIEYLE